jgi:hypothetical protein
VLTRYEPDQIRALRGRLSRAAFAKRLKVTALTVYRWELPVTAAESRRPRGSVLARLNDYARDADRAQTLPETQHNPNSRELLADAIQRLTLRGMTPTWILRELLDVLELLFPGAALRLEDIGEDAARPIGELGGAQTSTREVVELSDGSGRRLRLSASGLPPHARDVLTSVAKVAGLALEVAQLRDRLAGC